MRTPSRYPDRIQPEWAGATVAILGGGPSLTQEQVEACRGRVKVIAINNSVTLAPWADILYFCDAERWYRWHSDWVHAFKGMVVTLRNFRLRQRHPNMKCLRVDGAEGLCESSDGLRHGSNSGYQCINLCVHLGARKVILLGYDMRAVDGKTHWHEEHPQPAGAEVYEHTMRPKFKTLVEPLGRLGITVINATPGSAIECFPRMSLEEALSD